MCVQVLKQAANESSVSMVILSDANTVFIDDILEAQGLQASCHLCRAARSQGHLRDDNLNRCQCTQLSSDPHWRLQLVSQCQLSLNGCSSSSRLAILYLLSGL